MKNRGSDKKAADAAGAAATFAASQGRVVTPPRQKFNMRVIKIEACDARSVGRSVAKVALFKTRDARARARLGCRMQ